MESQENQGRMADKPSGIQGMKRRTFIKAIGAFGLSTALPWGNVYGQERKSAEFLRKRSSVSARWGDEAGLSFSKFAILPTTGYTRRWMITRERRFSICGG